MSGKPLLFEIARDYFRYQFLLEPLDVEKFRTDAALFKTIQNLAHQRQKIFIRLLDPQAKLVADVDFVVPFDRTAADADLTRTVSTASLYLV